MLNGAATPTGQGGCSIWIRHSDEGSGPARSVAAATTLLVAEPSLFAARANARGLPITIVTFHAPHAGREPSEINRWWD